MKYAFYKLLKESTIIQGIIAFAVVGVMLYLYIVEGTTDTNLNSIVMLILGFYFGNKSQQQARSMLNDYKADIRQHSNRQRNN